MAVLIGWSASNNLAAFREIHRAFRELQAIVQLGPKETARWPSTRPHPRVSSGSDGLRDSDAIAHTLHHRLYET